MKNLSYLTATYLRTFLVASVLTFLAIAANAQNKPWKLADYKIGFMIKNANIAVNGTFSGLAATFVFDSNKPENSNIEATIDAKSINTGVAMRDDHLRKDEYFGVAKYPKITLKSGTITRKPDGSFVGNFKLTLKNVTKDIAIPFTFVEKGNTATAKGSFIVNRVQYGVGTSGFVMGDVVTISLSANLSK